MELDESRSTSFSLIYKIIFLCLIIFGLFVRWYGLEERPVQADEAHHGTYPLYYSQDKALYQYDPALHGPFLFWAMPWSFWIFGVNKFALRFPVALIGSFFLFAPLLFRRWMSPTCMILMTAFVAVSPTLTYWSRFLHFNSFVFLSIIGMLVSLYLSQKTLRIPAFLFFLALHFCIKENAYIHTLLALGFLFYEYVLYAVMKTPYGQKSFLSSGIKYLIHYKLSFAIGLLLAGLLYSWFYSNGFLYPEGILDGAKSVIFWWNLHLTEIHPGAFSHHFLHNTFYESWWAPFIILHVIFFYWKRDWKYTVGLLISLLFGYLGYFFFNQNSFLNTISSILKLKIPFDFFLVFPLIFHAVSSTTAYLLEKKRDLGVCSYVFFSSLFTYSHLGDKGSWLASYPLLAAIIFFSFYLSCNLTLLALPLVTPFLLLNGFWNWELNLEKTERRIAIAVTHPTPQYERQLIHLNRELSHGKSLLARPCPYIPRAFHWPLTWYLYENSKAIFYKQDHPSEHYDYIFIECYRKKMAYAQAAPYMNLKNYKKTIFRSQWAWVPQWEEMSLLDITHFYWSKRPWHSPLERWGILFEKTSFSSADNEE